MNHFRWVFSLILLTTCECYCVQAQSRKIEGVYEFVSRTSTFTEPKATSEHLDSEHWLGIWIFHDGYFSKALIKKRERDKDIETALLQEAQPQDCPERATGKYSIRDGALWLNYSMSQSVFSVGGEVMEYRLKDALLTLTENFFPNRHGNARGQEVTVLRRIRK